MEKSGKQIDGRIGNIEKWYAIQEKLVAYFKPIYAERVTEREIFEALFILLAEKEKLEWMGSLWDVDIEYEEAFELLSNFNFDTVFNKIETPQGFIPQDFLIEYKVRIKAKGQIWIIHKYDSDPFPSNPHAHDVRNNIKLDLSNGNCFRVRDYIYTIKKKDLLLIRQKAQEVFKGTLPELGV